jgi:hypothetical protein
LLNVEEELDIDLGSGNDIALLVDIAAGEDIDFQFGSGDDDVTIETLTGGDDISLRAGSGDDSVVGTSITAADDFFVRLEAGDDLLDLALSAAADFRVEGGAGANDELVLDAETDALIDRLTGFEVL